LAEEKVAHQTTKQSLQTSDEARADLERDLEVVHTSLIATTNKLASKSSALDFAVVREQKMEIQLKVAEEMLKVAEEKMKTQGQLLDMAQQALSKRECSTSAVIYSVVANAMGLVKNHMPKFDAKILRKDFTVDDMERAAFVDSTYDTA
jgi:hypothetical protein